MIRLHNENSYINLKDYVEHCDDVFFDVKNSRLNKFIIKHYYKIEPQTYLNILYDYRNIIRRMLIHYALQDKNGNLFKNNDFNIKALKYKKENLEKRLINMKLMED